jgi:hypothetical protein
VNNILIENMLYFGGRKAVADQIRDLSPGSLLLGRTGV